LANVGNSIVNAINNFGGGVAAGLSPFPSQNNPQANQPFYDPNSAAGMIGKFGANIAPFMTGTGAVDAGAGLLPKLPGVAAKLSGYGAVGAAVTPNDPGLGAVTSIAGGSIGNSVSGLLGKKAAQLQQMQSIVQNADPETVAGNIVNILSRANPMNHIDGYSGDPSSLSSAAAKNLSALSDPARNAEIGALLIKQQGENQQKVAANLYDQAFKSSPAQNVPMSNFQVTLQNMIDENANLFRGVNTKNPLLSPFLNKLEPGQASTPTVTMPITDPDNVVNAHNLQSYLGAIARNVKVDDPLGRDQQDAFYKLQDASRQDIHNALGPQGASMYQGATNYYNNNVVPYLKNFPTIMDGSDTNPNNFSTPFKNPDQDIQTVLSHSTNGELQNRILLDRLKTAISVDPNTGKTVVDPTELANKYATLFPKNMQFSALLNKVNSANKAEEIANYMKGTLNQGIGQSIGSAAGAVLSHIPGGSVASASVSKLLGNNTANITNILNPMTREDLIAQLQNKAASRQGLANFANKSPKIAAGLFNALLSGANQ
jgi:hypothetical protein